VIDPPSAENPPERRSRRALDANRRRRRRIIVKVVLGVVLLGLAFFAGLAVGRAVEDTPQPGGTQTLVRTLEPVPIAPAP
jgi:hypothetical protein